MVAELTVAGDWLGWLAAFTFIAYALLGLVSSLTAKSKKEETRILNGLLVRCILLMGLITAARIYLTVEFISSIRAASF